MNRDIHSIFKLSHRLVLFVLILVFANSTVAFAGAGSYASKGGSVRFLSSWSDNSVSISGTDNPPVLVLSARFRVPAGRKAHVQATFSATLLPNIGQYAYCFGRFTLDTPPNAGNVFYPGAYQLIGGETAKMPNALTVAMTGHRRGVGPGVHRVRVYVHSAYAGCQLQERALNVIVNIR